MLNRIRLQIVSKWVFFFLFYLLTPGLCLESSLVNPDLAPKLLEHTNFATGYEDFAIGRTYFNEENWGKATHFFTQAVEKSYKPYFECSNYLDDEGYRSVCEDGYNEDISGYSVRRADYEIIIAIYRHSHFYLGLIRLYQGEIPKANLHFKKAIGFNGIEDNLGFNFYRCANIINPSWIVLASLTRLQIGKVEEAEALINMGFWTLENFEYTLSQRFWGGNVTSKYWDDLNKRGITSQKWQAIQQIILLNTASIIASAQSDLKEAIDLASQAIHYKDYRIKNQLFPFVQDNFF